jgi:hypothetical protein
MIALALLVVSVAILVQIESNAMMMTKESSKIVTGTELAQQKLSEAMLTVEKEGFTDADHCESGDFSDFGDETMNLEFGDGLDGYHFEWCVMEVDIQLAGDIAGMAQNLAGTGALPGAPAGLGDAAASAGIPGMGAGGSSGIPDLGSLGMNPEMISQMLGKYIRAIQVRVWWGDDSKKAKEAGDEVVITTHVINPTGAVIQTQADPMAGT